MAVRLKPPGQRLESRVNTHSVHASPQHARWAGVFTRPPGRRTHSPFEEYEILKQSPRQDFAALGSRFEPAERRTYVAERPLPGRTPLREPVKKLCQSEARTGVAPQGACVTAGVVVVLLAVLISYRPADEQLGCLQVKSPPLVLGAGSSLGPIRARASCVAFLAACCCTLLDLFPSTSPPPPPIPISHTLAQPGDIHSLAAASPSLPDSC
ncbi:hypothetical protein P154DRAFT_583161 [Amniculicola lignicola CBS 123094]|uniref:Uncharacterized protein n=1 Tax=Amniculicola lignicola CBS 123094 TaxID=1392246 RepID=A0A6A5W1Q7_9PLEO|nr:hypothetical protein P154DRAFT_583161 [Amniculicola lignicola CBS 123094]